MPKKSFKDTNPAMQFITLPQADEPRQERGGAPGGRQLKTRRLNLLVPPGLAEDLTKLARMQKTSVNGLINAALEQYAKGHSALIARYDEVFKGED